MVDSTKTRFNFNPDVKSDADMLGFDQYIQTLSGMIKDPDFKTPFCIGVYGTWGSGKTTFMRLLSEEIHGYGKPVDTSVKDGKTKDAKPYVIPVWFNPWRYEKEAHLIIPFLKTIEQEIKTYEENKRGLPEKLWEPLKKIATRMGDVAAAFAYGTRVDFNVVKLDFDKVVKRDEERREQKKKEDMTLGDSLSSIYYDAIGQLGKFADETAFRIAVFVDDLDRCLPEKAIELLEAMKLFFDLTGYLFVIGVDRSVVEKGIAWHYRYLDANMDGGKGAPTVKSEDYLDKMIQFPLELPLVEAAYKTAYIKSLLHGNEAYENLAGLIEKGIGDNPRALKRFVNLLAFMSWHADTIKAKILGDEKESEDVKNLKNLVRGYFVPAIYVKWSLIVFKFPEQYKAIKGKRHLLIEMQGVAIGKAAEESLPALEDMALPQTLREILKEEPFFPDDDAFLSKLIHLVQATRIAPSIGREEERPFRTALHEPGEMALINKGSFFYGVSKKEKRIDYDYYMDVFPVTNKQYKAFIDARPNHPVPYVEKEEWAKPYNWDRRTPRTYPKGKANHPVVPVSYEDAIAYCQWRTEKEHLPEGTAYRLPTEEEWEKAARGNDGRIYPWGNEFDKEKCNTYESGIGGTTEVTKYPEGASPYGCFDMAGNVWEWTDSDYDKNNKVLRGGSWIVDQTGARCAYRYGSNPNDRNDVVGFRCSRTVK